MLGRQLRKTLFEKNISQSELARRVKRSRMQVWRWLNGYDKIPLDIEAYIVQMPAKPRRKRGEGSV